MKRIGIAIVVAQSFASINVPEASTWAMMLFGFGRRTARSVSEKAETIGPISFAERMPVASLAAKRFAVRNQAADCSLELQFAVWPSCGPGRSIAFNLARAFQSALARDQARAIGVATPSDDPVQFRVDNRMARSGVRIRSACPAQQAGR